MTEQFIHDGIDAPQSATDRLFFALLPDDYAATQADRFRQRLCSEQGLTGMQVRTEHLHVTLHHLGDHAGVPQDLVAQGGEVAASLTASVFEAEFESVMSIPRGQGASPLVLCGGNGLAALSAFQRTLGVAMIRAGLGRWVNQSFMPHMTLAYDRQAIERRDIRPIAWTVRELVLIHSLLGQTRHVALGRWPLRERLQALPRQGGASR